MLISSALAAASPSRGAEGPEIGPIPPTHPQRRVERLWNSRRDKAMKPEAVVEALGLGPGQVVADIGSGPGYFTFRFARAVGPTGRVFGVDIEPHFISELERRSASSGMTNVLPILATPDDSGLPQATCDLVFFCSSYRHIGDRVGYLRELRSRMKPGGRVAIIEWRKIATLDGEKRLATRIGPREEDKFDPGQVIQELREAGFTVVERPDFLEYHYFLIAGVGG